MILTGNFQFKKTIFGLVLMVEYQIDKPFSLSSCDCPGPGTTNIVKKWKRAKLNDLKQLNLNV